MREEVHHPATARELIRVLGIPRDRARGIQAPPPVARRRRRAGPRPRQPLRPCRSHGSRRRPPRRASRPASASSRRSGRPKACKGDVFIAAPNLNEALHGDRVVVRIERHRAGRPRRGSHRPDPRAPRADGGRPFRHRRRGPRLRRRRSIAASLTDVSIPRGETRDAEPGDMVTVEITRWPTPTRGPRRPRSSKCSAASTSPASTPRSSCASTPSPTSIPTRRSQEAARLGSEVRERDLQGRTDFRDRPVVTIDGEDARDFDDAISIERLPNGHFWLGVHIADVAHYVTEGSALDLDAYERGTSVYFPERAVHMFPEALATGLCSLRPHVDRLVQSCLMEVDDARRGRALRNARRRDPQHRADDVHGRQRHPDRPRSGDARAIRPLVPMFELMRELFRDPERASRAAAARSISICRSPRSSSTTKGSIEDIVALRAERRAPADRGVHAARQRDRGRAPRDATRCRRCTASTSRRIR